MVERSVTNFGSREIASEAIVSIAAILLNGIGDAIPKTYEFGTINAVQHQSNAPT